MCLRRAFLLAEADHAEKFNRKQLIPVFICVEIRTVSTQRFHKDYIYVTLWMRQMSRQVVVEEHLFVHLNEQYRRLPFPATLESACSIIASRITVIACSPSSGLVLCPKCDVTCSSNTYVSRACLGACAKGKASWYNRAQLTRKPGSPRRYRET